MAISSLTMRVKWKQNVIGTLQLGNFILSMMWISYIIMIVAYDAIDALTATKKRLKKIINTNLPFNWKWITFLREIFLAVIMLPKKYHWKWFYSSYTSPNSNLSYIYSHEVYGLHSEGKLMVSQLEPYCIGWSLVSEASDRYVFFV